MRREVGVAFKVAADGRSANLESPVPLFAAHVGRVVEIGPNASYSVTADGQRFLMNTVVQNSSGAPVRLILNWKPPRR